MSETVQIALVKVIPAWQEVKREVLIVMGGAMLAAFIIGQVSQLRMRTAVGGGYPSR